MKQCSQKTKLMATSELQLFFEQQYTSIFCDLYWGFLKTNLKCEINVSWKGQNTKFFPHSSAMQQGTCMNTWVFKKQMFSSNGESGALNFKLKFSGFSSRLFGMSECKLKLNYCKFEQFSFRMCSNRTAGVGRAVGPVLALSCEGSQCSVLGNWIQSWHRVNKYYDHCSWPMKKYWK